MQLHELTSKNQKSKKRVGRGGKRGTYSGKGMKGQKARAGRKLRPEWRDALKSIPKKRGYKNKGVHEKPAVLNLNKLNTTFNDGDLVTPNALLQKNLIAKIGGHLPDVKILGDGELNKKLSFKEVEFSKSAREKIEKAGGSIK